MRISLKAALILIVGLVFSFCQINHAGRQTVDLSLGWKFTTGDNLAYADPEFDDANWHAIRVDQTWNKQGWKKYEGFAWYRKKVIIPSALKKNPYPNDSLVFYLGKIDDFDQVFLNGALIGENLKNMPRGAKPGNEFKELTYSYWNVQRRYTLPVNDPRINWDGENVLAVRVFDWGVAGGIFGGKMSLTTPDFNDYIEVDYAPGEFSDHQGQLGKSLTIKNTASGYRLEGSLVVRVKNNLDQSTVFIQSYPLHLEGHEELAVTFRFPKPLESTSILYSVKLDKSRKPLRWQEGVPYILTPPPKETPQINGALIYGQRPGKPFLYRIAATGKRPIRFTATGLPAGLSLDETTGIISGRVDRPGSYSVRITATNDLGKDQKTLRIEIGERIALTPPMGWNSWNVWGLSVTQERIYAAAKAFVARGLADHGWTYINIDDGWEIPGASKEAKRTPNGEIRTNRKFPDMKELGQKIHALGLKFGIYSSPGALTCGKFTGSYKHEQQDARTFAKWGIDYLKYDLCGYRKLMKDVNDPVELMPPYELMHRALQKVDRDIVYSICEYGNGKVWEWGAKVGGNLWRTTGDIWDDWDRMASIGFNQQQAAPYAGPGHWNDPDMLVIGWVGWGEHLHRTRLTPDEQYTHVSLWALLSAPLLLGCDLKRLDDFTLNLITNDEVIAVDQDPSGQQAVPVIADKTIQVYRKKLSDGSLAVGIFNIGKQTRKYSLPLEKLGLDGAATVRDLWRQKDLGIFKKAFHAVVPPHGVVLIKVAKK